MVGSSAGGLVGSGMGSATYPLSFSLTSARLGTLTCFFFGLFMPIPLCRHIEACRTHSEQQHTR